MADTAQLAEPFTLRNAGSGVANPSTLPPDVTDLGTTDPDQLITNFLSIASACSDSDLFQGIGNVANGAYGILLTPSEVENLLNLSNLNTNNPQHDAVVEAIGGLGSSDTPWLLVVPECSKSEDIETSIRDQLGPLVDDSEIAALISSLGVTDSNDCTIGANIVDLTPLHDEVSRRFQVLVATNVRVVEAEKALILAQAALEDFIRLHPETCPSGPTLTASEVSICNEYISLVTAVENAAEAFARAISEVYDELEDDYLPPHDLGVAKAERRKEITLGILGIFIPLTAEDAAIEAALIAGTVGFGKVASIFDGVFDLFRLFRLGDRGNVDAILAKGSEAAAQADAIKLGAYLDDFPEFSGMDYADIVRIEGKVGAENLYRINGSPELVAAFAADPVRVDAWKIIDDLGSCSFEGSTTVVTEFGNKPISQLVVGIDKVLSRNEKTGEHGYKNIVAKYSNYYPEQVIIESANATTGEFVSVISNKIHPIFVIAKSDKNRVSSEGHYYAGMHQNGVWVDASELLIGDELLNDDGTRSYITSVTIIDQAFEAFNLSVADFKTYFVGQHGKQSKFWVHNSCINTDVEMIDSVKNWIPHLDKVELNKVGDKIEIVSKTDGRVIGGYHEGKIHATLDPLEFNILENARALGPNDPNRAIPVGDIENGFQTFKIGDEYYLGKVTNNGTLNSTDIEDLTALSNSHTIARHGPNVTDDQLLLRAREGIAPDGFRGNNPPPYSSAFDSEALLVASKNEALTKVHDPNYFTSPDPQTRIVKFESSEAVGRGFARDAALGSDPVVMKNVRAIMKLDAATNQWKILTMHPEP